MQQAYTTASAFVRVPLKLRTVARVTPEVAPLVVTSNSRLHSLPPASLRLIRLLSSGRTQSGRLVDAVGDGGRRHARAHRKEPVLERGRLRDTAEPTWEVLDDPAERAAGQAARRLLTIATS